jgi:hypothetical protein
MTARSDSKKSASKTSTTHQTKGTHTMNAHPHSKKPASHATHGHHATTTSETTTEIAQVTSAPVVTPAILPATSQPVAATSISSTPAAPSIAPPPADANIPTPPSTAASPNGTDFKGVQPKASEQAALKAALADLTRFTSYAQLLGASAPPVAQVIVLLTLGVEWTGMRNATAAWFAYCRTQEGLVWALIRQFMERLKPAWDLAVTADASLTSQFPGLASLLGAKKAIAQKAVSTKRANKKAEAQGKAPLHGVVGKQRKRAAKNAAYAAATSATSAPPAEPIPPVASAPSSGPAPVALSGAGAAPATPNGGTASPNGAVHS